MNMRHPINPIGIKPATSGHAPFRFAKLLTLFLVAAISQSAFGFQTTVAEPPKKQDVDSVKDVESGLLGSTQNVHQCGNLMFSGQFAQTDLAKVAESSVKRVISLRTDGEVKWDEKALVEASGIEFVAVPFRKPDSLTDDVFGKVRKLLKDQNKKTLFHCGSANRVGAVWLPYRVLDQGVSLETAMKEAKKIGLRAPPYEAKAIDYIKRMQAKTTDNTEMNSDENDGEVSVKPGINKTFLNEDLDVDAFVKRFEMESREVFASRKAIIEACQLKPSDTLADIGAGTGLFSRMFASQLDDGGKVLAVDIAPRFIDHINAFIKEKSIDNISTILCTGKSAELPTQSVNAVFICDTYHHFEFPMSTLKTIHDGLKPGGQLVIVDFNRIKGTSRDWILGHVRAGKEEVRAEIQDAGFDFVEEVKIPTLSENYFLRFRKPPQSR